MAVFRVEKSKDYTVMCNHHLRNRDLSLKAKGLLSQMLSLPENWDYTLRGLAAINMEKLDAIRTAVLELEQQGYIIRQQGRTANGKMAAIEYTIYEQPQPPASPRLENPNTAKPTLEKPCSDYPNTVKPNTENPTQLSIESNKILKKSNTDLSNIQSINPAASPPDGTDRIDARMVYEKIVKENLEYDILCDRYEREQLDEIVGLIIDTVCSTKRTIRVGGEDKPVAVVQSVFLKLDFSHIEYVIDRLKDNTTKIRNIRSYLITTLYNARFTMDSYYRAEVNHDLYGTD